MGVSLILPAKKALMKSTGRLLSKPICYLCQPNCIFHIIILIGLVPIASSAVNWILNANGS